MYPTKEQILAKKPRFKKGTITAVKQWKKEYIKGWKYIENTEKIKLLKILIKTLEDVYQKPVKDVVPSTDDMYDTKNQTIHLKKTKPSIISTLHEFGHHILGTNELKVCIWSVWLFKESFPGLYNNLVWENHLLVKK